MLAVFLSGSLGFSVVGGKVVMFGFVNISQVIGWEGWTVFWTSQEIGCEDHLWNDLYCVEWVVEVSADQ